MTLYQRLKQIWIGSVVMSGYREEGIRRFILWIRDPERVEAMRTKKIPWWQFNRQFERWLELRFPRTAIVLAIEERILYTHLMQILTIFVVIAIPGSIFICGLFVGHYLWR